MTLAIWILGALVVLTTALPFVRKGYWWIRVFDFPRPLIAVSGTPVLAGVPLLGPTGAPELLLAGAVTLSVGYQLFQIFPYLPVAPRQVARAKKGDPQREISILVANVLMDNRRADDLLRIVEQVDADMVLAMETDDWWASRLEVLKASYPFSIEHPLENTYGMLLFSKLELSNPRCRYLVEDRVPSFYAQARLRSGDVIDFHAVHPSPPQVFQDTFERDAELLLIGREVRRAARPAIVAGDLNDVAWSHTTRLFQRLSGLVDPRVGRGLYSTFNAKIPLVRWPLDHIFHDRAFQVRRMKRLPYFGSDHFPILGKFVYRPEKPPLQAPAAPSPSDHEEAREKIGEVLPAEAGPAGPLAGATRGWPARYSAPRRADSEG